MFRWYRNAAICYVYLADVSRPALGADDKSSQPPWEPAFLKSRWFTRGWTLQELLAPASVEFFSKEGEKLGNRKSLERHIGEITGIPVKALRGSPLSDFSITERLSWQESRETKRKEDKAYSLLGIFDVSMPLIYGEGGEKAFKRLREEIDKTSKGIKREDFSVAFSLSDVSEIEHFVAREEELAEMHRTLSSDGSRRTVVLHGLGGIGKTELTIAYAKRHKDSYTAVFWLNIKDEDSVKQGFAKVARQILREHPSASWLSSVDMKANLDEVVDAVKAWLSLPNNTRWLMIYDNYDNPKLPGNADPTAVDIRKFLPESYQGSVIITTRSSQVEIGHCIKITKLEDMHDSLKISSNVSRRKGVIKDKFFRYRSNKNAESTDEEGSDDIYIAVMGMTGAGKSSFIQLCTKEPIEISHSLISFGEYQFVYKDYNIHLIDTPGFDDTTCSATEVLRNIAGWLGTAYEQKKKLSGIVYLHRISDLRMTGSAKRNLYMFKKLCGEEYFPSVILATTMWDLVDKRTGDVREAELLREEDFWGYMIKKGSMVMRHYGGRESAMWILEKIIEQHQRGDGDITLRIQKEIVDQGMELNNTAAGRHINEEINRLTEKRKKELESLEQDGKEALAKRDLKAAESIAILQRNFEEEIAKGEKDREDLKVSFEKLQEQREKELSEMEEQRKRHEEVITTNSENLPDSDLSIRK